MSHPITREVVVANIIANFHLIGKQVKKLAEEWQESEQLVAQLAIIYAHISVCVTGTSELLTNFTMEHKLDVLDRTTSLESALRKDIGAELREIGRAMRYKRNILFLVLETLES